MDALTYIRSEMRRHADEAKLAIDAAEKAGRDLTDQDRANVMNHTDAIADLRAKEERLLKDAEMRSAVDTAVGSLSSPAASVDAPAPAPSTIGEAFISSPQYKALVAGGTIGAGEFSFRVGGEEKAVPFMEAKVSSIRMGAGLNVWWKVS